MTEEEKKTLSDLFEAIGKTGAQFQIGQVIGSQTNTYNYYGDKQKTGMKTEEDVRQAIGNLMEMKDEQGGYLMRDQDQWYAIFRVLSAFCGYPLKASDFSRTMDNLGMAAMRVPCRYDSFRKISPHQLPHNVGLWHQYQNTADQYAQKQVVVAVKLMELLDISGC